METLLCITSFHADQQLAELPDRIDRNERNPSVLDAVQAEARGKLSQIPFTATGAVEGDPQVSSLPFFLRRRRHVGLASCVMLQGLWTTTAVPRGWQNVIPAPVSMSRQTFPRVKL